MIEVSEDLYNEVVEPYKKKKGFGRLVVQLLEAYRTNDSIYSYINGTMDGLENEATEELLKDLNNMAQSLSMFGVLHNQAEVVIDEGQRAFNDFGNQAKEDNSKFESPKEEAKETLTKEDVVSIVNDSISDIKSMLKDLLEQKDVSAPVVEKVQEQVHEVVEAKINNDLGTVVTDKNSSQEVYNHVAEKQVSNEEQKQADSAIESLLGSLNFK